MVCAFCSNLVINFTSGGIEIKFTSIVLKLSKFSVCEVKHFAMVVLFIDLCFAKRFVVSIKVAQRKN